MLPLTTDPSRPQAWPRGQSLPRPADTLPVPGFEHYVWDAVGQVLLCEAHRDRCNRQHKRRVVRMKTKSGCRGWTVRRLGVAVWMGEERLKRIVEMGVK
ncbi:hypothetical protein GCM10027044_28620 [Hymenobacter ruber]